MNERESKKPLLIDLRLDMTGFRAAMKKAAAALREFGKSMQHVPVNAKRKRPRGKHWNPHEFGGQ